MHLEKCTCRCSQRVVHFLVYFVLFSLLQLCIGSPVILGYYQKLEGPSQICGVLLYLLKGTIQSCNTQIIAL
jgi:hypothetical protein